MICDFVLVQLSTDFVQFYLPNINHKVWVNLFYVFQVPHAGIFFFFLYNFNSFGIMQNDHLIRRPTQSALTISATFFKYINLLSLFCHLFCNSWAKFHHRNDRIEESLFTYISRT